MPSRSAHDQSVALRGIALGLTLAGHLLLLLLLDAPGAPTTDAPALIPEHRADALRVRLLAPASTSAATVPLRPASARRLSASARTADRRSRLAAPALPSPAPTESARPNPPATVIVIVIVPSLSAPTHDTVAGYVAGGGRFSADRPAPVVPSLPGAMNSSLPPIPMHAQARHPLQRLVGILHDLGGGKNQACLDVETWQALSTEELVARHISPRDIVRLREAYRCVEPPHHLQITF